MNIKIKKTKDLAPILNFKGRHIEVKSEGMSYNTHVFIDDKEVIGVQSMTIRCDAGGVMMVEMTLLDFIANIGDAK